MTKLNNHELLNSYELACKKRLEKEKLEFDKEKLEFDKEKLEFDKEKLEFDKEKLEFDKENFKNNNSKIENQNFKKLFNEYKQNVENFLDSPIQEIKFKLEDAKLKRQRWEDVYGYKCPWPLFFLIDRYK